MNHAMTDTAGVKRDLLSLRLVDAGLLAACVYTLLSPVISLFIMSGFKFVGHFVKLVDPIVLFMCGAWLLARGRARLDPFAGLMAISIMVALAAPLLAALANLIGVLGGMIIAVLEAGVTWRFYWDQVLNTLIMADYVQGICKTLFFGFFIAVIACHQGLSTRGGTEGVGHATTRAVVAGSLMIFISDFFLTKLFLLF